MVTETVIRSMMESNPIRVSLQNFARYREKDGRCKNVEYYNEYYNVDYYKDLVGNGVCFYNNDDKWNIFISDNDGCVDSGADTEEMLEKALIAISPFQRKELRRFGVYSQLNPKYVYKFLLVHHKNKAADYSPIFGNEYSKLFHISTRNPMTMIDLPLDGEGLWPKVLDRFEAFAIQKAATVPNLWDLFDKVVSYYSHSAPSHIPKSFELATYPCTEHMNIRQKIHLAASRYIDRMVLEKIYQNYSQKAKWGAITNSIYSQVESLEASRSRYLQLRPNKDIEVSLLFNSECSPPTKVTISRLNGNKVSSTETYLPGNAYSFMTLSSGHKFIKKAPYNERSHWIRKQCKRHPKKEKIRYEYNFDAALKSVFSHLNYRKQDIYLYDSYSDSDSVSDNSCNDYPDLA